MQPKSGRSDATRHCLPRGTGSFWDHQLRARLGQDMRVIFEGSLGKPIPEHLRRSLLQMESLAREGRLPRDEQ